MAALLAGCGDSSSSSTTTTTTTTIAAYSGTVNVSMLNDAMTVTWTPAAGDTYNVYSDTANPSTTSATRTKHNTTPVSTSPQTFTTSFGTSTFRYVWVTRVVGSSESGAPAFGSTAFAQINAIPNFTTSTSTFKLSGPVVAVQFVFATNATAYELHHLPDATTVPSATTLVSSGATSAALSETLTSFVDSSGVPLVINYAIMGIRDDGAGNVMKRYVVIAVSPSYVEFTLGTPCTPSASGSFAATTATVFWTAAGSICSIAKTSYGTAVSTQVRSIGGTATKVLAETLTGTDWAYFLVPGSSSGFLGRIDMTTASAPVCGNSGCFTTSFNSGVALAQNATNLYAATSTTVTLFPKSSLTGTTAAGTTQLASALVGVTDMVISGDGTTLYVATSTGITKFPSTGGAPTILFGTLSAVKGLALDVTGNTLYFVMASAVPAKIGADAIYALNLANTSSAPAVVDGIYGGTGNLAFNNGQLAWTAAASSGSGNAYTWTVAASTLTQRAAGAGPLLLDTDGSLFLRVSGVTSAVHLPAAWSYTPPVPAAAAAFTVTTGDEQLSNSTLTVLPTGAEALLLTQDGVVKSALTNTNFTLTGLTNGVTYTMGLTPVSMGGTGTAATTTGTPRIAGPSSLTGQPKDGSVDFSFNTSSPRSRPVTLKLYQSATQPVDTSATASPVQTAIVTQPVSGGAINLVNYVTPNGTLFYYNGTVVENDATSVSLPIYAANTELWTNAAAAAVTIDAATGPSHVANSLEPARSMWVTNNGNTGHFLYWIESGGTLNTMRRDDTSLAPSSASVTPATVKALDALTTDGFDIFGYDTSAAAVYIVTTPTAVVASVGTTKLLDSSLLVSFTGTPSAITAVSGLVYVGTTTGLIFSVNGNATGATLVKDTGAVGIICEIQFYSGLLLWTQHPTLGTGGCTSGGQKLRRTLANGTGTVDDLVALTGGSYFTHMQGVTVGTNNYVYYSSTADLYIHRLDLFALTSDVPVAEVTSGYFAVDSSNTNGKIYFTNAGTIYTLDSQQRRLAWAVTTANGPQGISILNTKNGGMLYLYDNGFIYENPR